LGGPLPNRYSYVPTPFL
jgi:uncharacterized membrane protein YeiH